MRLRTWALLGAAVLTVTAGAPLLALETGGATGPPSWPASLAPYAGVLTSHRGVPPQSVEDRTAFSGRPTARVTDAKGTWRAYLQALGSSGGASLYQLQDNADGGRGHRQGGLGAAHRQLPDPASHGDHNPKSPGP